MPTPGKTPLHPPPQKAPHRVRRMQSSPLTVRLGGGGGGPVPPLPSISSACVVLTWRRNSSRCSPSSLDSWFTWGGWGVGWGGGGVGGWGGGIRG
jgi:hypothetical protein